MSLKQTGVFNSSLLGNKQNAAFFKEQSPLTYVKNNTRIYVLRNTAKHPEVIKNGNIENAIKFHP